MSKKFFDVFPTLQLKKQLHDIIEQTVVEKVSTTKNKDFLRIFARDKKDFLEKIDALPDGNNVLHGDFHPDNLMLGKDNELYLIDMMNVCKGPAEYDIARTYFLLGSNRQIQQDYLKLMETDFESIKPFHEIISLLRNREMGLE